MVWPVPGLGPVLEEETDARAGEVLLAKLDVDSNPELAARYDIRGIPAVKAFRDGKVVAEFVGALPRASVVEFLDELTGPTPAERLVAELEPGELPEVRAAVEAGDHERALALLFDEITHVTRRAAGAQATPGGPPLRPPRHRGSRGDALPAAAGRRAVLMRAKEFHFPLSVEWIGGRRVRAAVDGKHSLDVATPPEFRGTDPDVWSPEDLFVSAAASCLAVTLAGLAEREGLRSRGSS